DDCLSHGRQRISQTGIRTDDRFADPRTDAMKLLSRPQRRLAFSLIEVMIAIGIFFIALFSILALTAQLLTNARVIQSTIKPHASMVHAWYTSKTNRITEGSTTVDFSDIA